MKLKYLFAALLTLIISPAHAELEIDVRGATRNPMPIAPMSISKWSILIALP